MDAALGIVVPLPLLPDPTRPTASYHKKPRTEQSRAAKLMQSEPVREKMFPLPQWKTAVLGPTPRSPS